MFYRNNMLLKKRYEKAKDGMHLWTKICSRYHEPALIVLGTGDGDLDYKILSEIPTYKTMVSLVWYRLDSSELAPNIYIEHITQDELDALIAYYSFIDFDKRFICLYPHALFGQMEYKVISKIGDPQAIIKTAFIDTLQNALEDQANN